MAFDLNDLSQHRTSVASGADQRLSRGAGDWAQAGALELINQRRQEGSHGKGPDAKQQREEETEGRAQSQKERKFAVAIRGGASAEPAGPVSSRQEAVADSSDNEDLGQ